MVSALDTLIPVIPAASSENIKSRFKYQKLTTITGKPNHTNLEVVTNELAQNAITSKTIFGCPKRGCLGALKSAAVYLKMSGVAWNVPASEGAYPVFGPNNDEHEKKKKISQFIKRETDLLKLEATEVLLKDQLIECVEDAYIRTLRKGDELMYDGRSVFEILNQLNKTYGVGDKHTIAAKMKKFLEKPDPEEELDVYFSKQEQCQKVVKDSKTPIREADMVLELVEHMDATGTYTKATVKFNREKEKDQTWDKAKDWFRNVATDYSEMEKYSGVTGDLLANQAVIQQTAAQEARDEVAKGMEHSFGQLAQAAVAKAETIDANANAIKDLTTALAKMTATCKVLTATNSTLVTALAKCGGGNATGAPPGFPQTGTTATGHAANTAGIVMPTKMGNYERTVFVSPQACSTCGKTAMFHLPQDCLELPANAKRKAGITAARALRAAGGKRT